MVLCCVCGALRYENGSVVADLTISAVNGHRQIVLKGVRSVKKLRLSTQSLDADKLRIA